MVKNDHTIAMQPEQDFNYTMSSENSYSVCFEGFGKADKNLFFTFHHEKENKLTTSNDIETTLDSILFLEESLRDY